MPFQFKRLFDIFFSIVLLIILSPLFPIIAILIKIDSRGPVFFKHLRVGKKKFPFKMWKFRTMVTGFENEPELTIPNDPRITNVGKFLRRLSLDELPQLVNVLCGQMSIVGPRPEIPEIVATYTMQQKQALTVKPGMTGLSQINGRDDLSIAEKLEYDIYYASKSSFFFDLLILFRTIPTLLSGRGIKY